MKHLICALITGFGLFIAFAPRAEAHGLDRVIVVHDGRVVRKFRPAYPHWLRKHRGFHHWYMHSRNHYQRHPNWHRLHKLYRQEMRYRRHVRKHFRSRHRHVHRHH